MAPVVKSLMAEPGIESVVCVTGQHRTMLHQVMNIFDLKTDFDLDIMVPNQTLNGLTSRIFSALDPLLEHVKPDRVLVHGDTTTAMVSAVAAFQRGISVAHVEAGLRTGNLKQPWPEEMNRRMVDIVSDLLFAPTAGSKDNLCRENLAGQIYITGNTVIDALMTTDARIHADEELRNCLDAQLPVIKPGRKILLVTGHRRENFGDGFQNICKALAELSARPDIEIIYPVHLNPNVQQPVSASLSHLPNVHLIAPLDYLSFVRLMQRAHVILTDSGGVQEEAPSLGKPVLVMRDVTERPEAVAAGTVELVGTEVHRIVAAVHKLYDSDEVWKSFAQRRNPYGDGYASTRIVSALLGQPVIEFGGELGLRYETEKLEQSLATI